MEEQVKKEYRPFDMSEIRTGGGGGDFADYVALPAEEAFEANITELKLGDKLNRTSGEMEPRLYIHVKLSKGEGAGQSYRGDVSPVISNGSKMSNLSKFLEKVYGKPQDSIDYNDILGKPVRVELSEPWGEKGLQFIKEFKKPGATQKKIDVTKVADVLPEDPEGVLAAAGLL